MTTRPGGARVLAERVAEVDGAVAVSVGTLAELAERLATGQIDAVVADYYLDDASALELLETLAVHGCDAPLLVLADGIGEELAAGVIRAGASDCLRWDNIDRLSAVLRRELDAARIGSRGSGDEVETGYRYRVGHDPLTGLATRALFTDRLNQAVPLAQRTNRIGAVLHLDIDRFNIVNASLGHAFGDRLLRIVAERLRGTVQAGDTVARLGGDEFLVLARAIETPTDVAALIARIQEAFADTYVLGGEELHLDVGIGVAMYPTDGTEDHVLLEHAAKALHAAKSSGSGNVRYFEADLNARAHEVFQVQRALQRAVEREGFELHYQPQIDLLSGRVSGCEALLRWTDPDLGHVEPGRFIPIAEETGLIVPIGSWVLDAAVAQAAKWRADDLDPFTVAINVSARQILGGSGNEPFSAQVAAAFARHGLAPGDIDLELELTESLLVTNDPVTHAELVRLVDLGCRLSIDDFGTGYSSLRYLREFPVDTMKIDRSFLADIDIDPDAAALVSALVGLAHGMGLRVVAEGVETQTQLGYLRGLRCDVVQGFLTCGPIPAADFVDFVRTHS